ncbi:radical SAM/SPASM domain-containing protein [Ensifer aridi]|uniref:radical SAM/SPASM domain-containing protein n=1 Tax=Ensifer aridi TaxID=1708715 RepID=UPI000A10AC00|nr:radical SAM protein [Ensifer aridi]
MSARFDPSPRHPEVHLFEAQGVTHLFLPNGSRLYEVDDEVAGALEAAIEDGGASVSSTLERYGLAAPAFVDDAPPEAYETRALSLAISQKCNLGCTYCYAEGGSFGEAPRNMPLDVALKAVDSLLSNAKANERYTLAFLGGEPLTNRAVLRAAVARALEWTGATGCRVNFSITTNGTLVTAEDASFFEEFGFAVTVSLDGIGEAHDRQRPFKNGRGSFDRIRARLAPLLSAERADVTARVTVTSQNLELKETLEGLLALGFRGVGFSPMLKSPRGVGEMPAAELIRFLQEMMACGRACEARLAAGETYGFLNLLTALQQIHRGTHRPYPCGAGAGYVAASADGVLYACHRFVGDDVGAMGSIADGVNRRRQFEWLTARHVHQQEPCRSCWARYMCGGGCHHEVIGRGRVACDYIRGWLQVCLQAYARLLPLRPDLFPRGGQGLGLHAPSAEALGSHR